MYVCRVRFVCMVQERDDLYKITRNVYLVKIAVIKIVKYIDCKYSLNEHAKEYLAFILCF